MTTKTRPAVPVGPYSPSVAAADFVFCSGQLPIDAQTGTLVGNGIAEQTRQAFENLRVVLLASGCDLADVVKTTIFLRDLDDFGDMNEAYAAILGANRPARSTVGGVDLPKGARIEIEAIALRRSTHSTES